MIGKDISDSNSSAGFPSHIISEPRSDRPAGMALCRVSVRLGALRGVRRLCGQTVVPLGELAEEHEMLRQTCRDFAQQQLKPIAGLKETRQHARLQ